MFYFDRQKPRQAFSENDYDRRVKIGKHSCHLRGKVLFMTFHNFWWINMTYGN